MKDYKNLGIDAKFRAVNGIASQEREWQSDFDQDAKMEKGPYANPTVVQKGIFETTLGGLVNFKDQGGTSVFTYSPATRAITINASLDITGGTVVSNSAITRNTEIYLPLSIEHNFTGGTSWLTNQGTRFKFDADDFPGFDFAFQATMAVEVAGRTAQARLYNQTDGTAVTGGTISGTIASISPGEDPLPIRSAGMTMPSGEKDYIVQRRQDPAGDGGDNMHMYLAYLVIIKN